MLTPRQFEEHLDPSDRGVGSLRTNRTQGCGHRGPGEITDGENPDVAQVIAVGARPEVYWKASPKLEHS